MYFFPLVFDKNNQKPQILFIFFRNLCKRPIFFFFYLIENSCQVKFFHLSSCHLLSSPFNSPCVCASLTSGAQSWNLNMQLFYKQYKEVDRSQRGLCEKIIKCFRECQESIAQHCQHSRVLQAIIRWHGSVRDVWQFIPAWSRG